MQESFEQYIPASEYLRLHADELFVALDSAFLDSALPYRDLSTDQKQVFLQASLTAVLEALSSLDNPFNAGFLTRHGIEANVCFFGQQSYLRLLRTATTSLLRRFAKDDSESASFAIERVTEVLSQAEARYYEAQLVEAQQNESDLQQQLTINQFEMRTFAALAENAPDGISVVDTNGILTYHNQAFASMLGRPTESFVGRSMQELLRPDERHRPAEVAKHVFTHGSWLGVLHYMRGDANFPAHVSVFALYDEQGEVVAVPGIMRDITKELREEEERDQFHQQIIEHQRMLLRELSSPLIPLSERAMVMPMIGAIDSQRAQQIIEDLLHGVAEQNTDLVILDITGVPIVDTHVANMLLQTTQAVKLLGARLILTGIRPEVAQTIVGLALDFSSIETHATLQAGIAQALRRN
jgi:PAS domain S-box-containing protein